MNSFINHNGNFLRADEPLLKINNRAFCYGDALFETMRWQDNKILFCEDHIERLLRGMKFLKMEIPNDFSFSSRYLSGEISELLKKNKIGGVARIRLQIYRNEGGYYTPIQNSTGFVISVEKLNLENYLENKKGLTIGIFNGIKKLKNPVSNFKTSNSIIYTLAGIFAKQNNLDDCFILNTDGYIADTISSNVFIVKNKTLITTLLSDGCVDGIMRKNILKICKKEKINTKVKSIQENEILSADEIFITNVIQGIRWIKQFRKKKYTHDFSKLLNSNLIRHLKKNSL